MNSANKDNIYELARKYNVAAVVLEDGEHKQHLLNFSKFVDEVVAMIGCKNQAETVAHQRFAEEKGWIAVDVEDIEYYKSKGQPIRDLIVKV